MSYIPDTDQSFHIRREFSISEAKVCDRNHKRKENDGNELSFSHALGTLFYHLTNGKS